MHVPKILVTNAIWKIILFSSSLLVNFFLVRMLKAELMAEFYSGIYWNAFFVMFFTFGMDIGLNYAISKGLLPANLLNPLIFLVVIAALVISLPLLYLHFKKLPEHTFSVAQKMILSGLYIFGSLLTVLYSSIFAGLHKNFVATQIGCAVNLVFLFGLFFIYFLKLPFGNPGLLFTAYFSTVFIQGCLTFVFCTTQFSSNEAGQLPVAAFATLLRYSGFAFFINLIFFLGTRFSIYLIPLHETASNAGNYMQAFKIVEFLQTFIAFVYYPFIAIVAVAPHKAAEKQVLFLIRLSNTFAFCMSVAIAIVGRKAFPLVYGSDFNKMYVVFLLLIPGLFCACSSSFVTAYFFGKAKNMNNFWSAIILLLASVFLYFIFRDEYTMRVAAVSFSFASFLSFGADLWFFRKSYPYNVREVLMINYEDIKQLKALL